MSGTIVLTSVAPDLARARPITQHFEDNHVY